MAGHLRFWIRVGGASSSPAQRQFAPVSPICPTSPRPEPPCNGAMILTNLWAGTVTWECPNRQEPP